MKSFSQFLQESYLSEEEARQLRLLTKDNIEKDYTKAGTGKGKVPFPSYDSVPTRSNSTATPPNRPSGGFGRQSQGQLSIPGTNVGRPGDAARNEAEIEARKSAERASNPKPPKPDGGSSGGGGKPPSGPKPSAGGGGKPPMVKGLKAPGVRSGGVLAGAIDTALEKSSGSGWARSLAKGTTTALGTIAGGALGSAAGPVGTFAGGTAGGMAASKAFDTAAGANAVQRRALATANRRSQVGGALVGIGGKTTFDTKKGTMTTGSGSQRRTVQLGKTSVVTGPGGKQDVGYLAYKGGKAVYKRADTKNLAQTSSNPLERIGRSLFAGAYKKSDAYAAAKKFQQARASDVARNKSLGVKMKPGG